MRLATNDRDGNGARRFGGARAAALRGGVSLIALLVAGVPGEARNLYSTGVVSPAQAALAAQQAASQQAAAAAAQAQVSLGRAAAALNAMRQAQKDAAAVAGAGNVPNGVTTGGLMPLNPLGRNQQSCGTSCTITSWDVDPARWINARGPVETVNGSQATVDITQTQSNAILNWQTFNVGRNTTLNFKQDRADWTVLNRVSDPDAKPSQILGQINAPGGVYVINRNGIIFGAGSQVNVHALVASTLDVGKIDMDQAARDGFFLTTGIANKNAFSIFDPVDGKKTLLTGGAVEVKAGASITTSIVDLDSPGFVYLFGANVTNAGTITAPAAQVGLVSARTIDIIPKGFSTLPPDVLGTDDSGKALTLRGVEFQISQFASSYNSDGDPTSTVYRPGTGAVRHEGLIEASRGIVMMNGDTIAIDRGVISMDTSTTRNSMTILRAATAIDMNGTISSLPYDDGTPLKGSAAFTPAYIEMSAQGSVTLEPGALISAPSARVALRAINLGSGTSGIFTDPAINLFSAGQPVQSNLTGAQQVLLKPGATIDVSGLRDVELPADYNFVSFSPRAEFADMPLQRTGALFGKTLWIDIRASGTRSDGTTWVGTPLADASGYVNGVGRGIQQLMTAGGKVSLTTDLTANSGGGRIETTGSVISMAGGSVNFQPGWVPTTRLLGIDGRIYTMANADPNMIYIGIAGQFTVDHSRWGVKETWSSMTQTYEPGYSEGRAAGGINVTTFTPVLQGTMLFGSVAGERQINSGQLPLQGSLALTTPSSVVIGDVGSDFFTGQLAATLKLSADTLSGYGLSSLDITSSDLVVSRGATLRLAPGGSVSATVSGAIDIAGNISAAGGGISLTTDRFKFANGFYVSPVVDGKDLAANIYVEGVLDVSGRFVNDTGRIGNDASGPGFINGGTISLVTNKSSGSVREDTTGSIRLAAGSLLDVSSGGYISRQGKPKTASPGTMAGKAGSISLLLYQGTDWVAPDNSGNIRPSSGPNAVLALDGAMRAYGFESNGSLALGSANTIRVGGSLQPGETSSIEIGGQRGTLPLSLLSGGGFGAYTLLATPDGWSGAASSVVFTAGTSLNLQQQNLSSSADYGAVGTGSKLATIALQPDGLRSPVNLTVKADNILLDTGASITTDPKAVVYLGGVPDVINKVEQPAKSVLLLGRITDHGGKVSINALKTWLGAQAHVDLSGTMISNFGFGTRSGPVTSATILSGGNFTVESALLSSLAAGTSLPPNLTGSYVVAESGAEVDVSGYAGTIGVRTSARGANTPFDVWSDAGIVSFDTGAFLWGGSFIARGGVSPVTGAADPRANGGTIILGGGAMQLMPDAQPVLDALSHVTTPTGPAALPSLAGNAFLAPFANSIVASVYRSRSSSGKTNDVLAAFDNVYLYSGGAPGGAARIFNDLSGNIYGNGPMVLAPLTISGDATGVFNWNVANRLHLAASSINVDPFSNTKVSLDAPYVLLTGYAQPLNSDGTPRHNDVAIAGNGVLNVSGQTIDIEGAALNGFGQVTFRSLGDIRLGTLKVVDGVPDTANVGATKDASRFYGKLLTAGNLLLSAQRTYPFSAVDFTIQTPGKVTFTAPAGSDTTIPLVAGGSLSVFAGAITQSGNLFAPLGQIKLGNHDTSVSVVTTSQVTLSAGSLTSVSLADTTVPYGAIQDGASWYYNASVNPLTQPPSKGLTLDGAKVETAEGSIIDLRGGGDLQAMEWIPGKGGSRDTLTTTPKGQIVYALLPSVNDPVAAFDIHFATQRSATTPGDVIPWVGRQITIDGGNGIPAGTYTLYPAHYATLPGALRVVYYGDSLGHSLPSGTTLPDGTVILAGRETQSTMPGKQSSGQAMFAVQTGDVWKQYSEYSLTGANSYFTRQAAKLGNVVPRLPMDAGRLAVIAQQEVILKGIALTQPARNGNGLLALDSSGNFVDPQSANAFRVAMGSEFDIASPINMAVVSHAQYAANDIPTGYLGLDVSQLNSFASILIGGLRSDTVKGTLITALAPNVLVDVRDEIFSAPEILLVAKPTLGALQSVAQTLDGSQPGGQSAFVDLDIVPAQGGTITIAGATKIVTTGGSSTGSGRNYYFADSNRVGSSTPQQIATALGGTLDATGTRIIGADLSKLDYHVTNPDGSITHHIGTISAGDLAGIRSYSYGTAASQPGLGAMFVATNDRNLKVSGPADISSPALSISFAPQAGLNAPVLTLPDAGRVIIAPGADITTGVLSLQATASTNAIVVNTSNLHVNQLNLTGRTVGIGAAAPVNDKSVAVYSGQFGDVQGLTLKALSGTISVYGDFNPGPAIQRLTLDAATITRDAAAGGNARITISGNEMLLPGSNAGKLAGSAADAPLLFTAGTPVGVTVQFDVRVTVTSATGVTTSYDANTPLQLAPNSSVALEGAGRLIVAGGAPVTFQRSTQPDGTVTVNQSSITLVNSSAATPASAGAGAAFGLELHAKDINLGGGSQAIAGYSTVGWFASDRVFVGGSGAMALGTGTDVVDLTVITPLVLVGSATASGTKSFALSTLGNVKIGRDPNKPVVLDRPEDSGETGGILTVKAANIALGFNDAATGYHSGSTIQAQAGQITLQATTGDVTLRDGAYIAAGGYKKTLVDVDTYVPGGKVLLQADAGNVTSDARSVIDVAQPADGLGYGGEIDVTALSGGASLAGALRGAGGGGLGGSFKLDSKNAVDLTALADRLLAGGVTGGIDIHTRTGNLVLLADHTLKANAITLVADDPTWDPGRQFGQIIIGGRIDARGYGGTSLNGTGQAGGQVGLYGANAVMLAGTAVIDASTTHADERGGDVIVGISWNAADKIRLQTGLQIDVSGGTRGGLSGGTVTFRAPRDGNNDVKIAAIDGNGNELATIDPGNIKFTGLRALTLEGYLAFDTTNSGKGIDGSTLGWDGTIDPAGWYNANGTVVTSGTWSNVSGWQPTGINNAAGFTGVPNPAAVSGGGGASAIATAVMGLRPNSAPAFSVQNPGLPANQSNIPIVFATPPGGVAAQGTASTNASGVLTITITNPGSGYTSVPTSVTVGGLAATVTGGRLQVVDVKITSLGNGAYDGTASAPSATFVGGGGVAIVNFTAGSNFSGQTSNGVFTPSSGNYIPWKSSGVFATFNPSSPGTASFIGGSSHRAFFADTLVSATQGTWTNGAQSYGFSNLYARMQPLVSGLGGNVVHVRPGIELLNSSGDITVKDNWNLASGTVGGLKTASNNPTTGQAYQYFDPASSSVNFNYRLVTPWGGLDSGALTLRAAGNLNVNASISDGFFQFGDYLDTNYTNWVAAYVAANKRSFDTNGQYVNYLNTYSASLIPIAPYKAAANSISPSSQDLASSDLFPHTLCIANCTGPNPTIVTAPSSWSYAMAAGADLASANPNATISLAGALQANKGDIIVNNHTSYTQPLFTGNGSTPLTISLPTMIRTGTGSVGISAARDVTLADTVAPGVIYAAGVNTAKLADPQYSGTSRVVAGNADGFLEPRVLAYGNGGVAIAGDGAGPYYGPPTAAAFPEQGGDVTIKARRDIIGDTRADGKTVQYYQAWLLAQTELTPANSAAAGASVSVLGAGVFQPFGSQIASQTAWWIQYGSFQQGILSAGGNVSVDAGRNLRGVSVSLPTTGRVSGGLSANSTPVTHVYGSGNMTVRAGQDILGGSFYEGSGHASIQARGAIGQNGTIRRSSKSTLQLPDVPLLAVDLGQIEMTSGNSMTIAGVINPAELHRQNTSNANPLDQAGNAQFPLYMDTYGPDSKVRLVAGTGDLTINIAPTAITTDSSTTAIIRAAASLYPASLEAIALNGNLTTTGISEVLKNSRAAIPMPGIVLSPSEHGTLQMLAQGNVDLTFGYPKNTLLLQNAPRPFFSAGPALIQTAFDPFQPNSGFDGSVSGARLAHEADADDTKVRIYAAGGDIIGTGSYGPRITGDVTSKSYQRIEINRPAKFYAGRDIIDLNAIIQNIHTYDVSTVQAGRNITYTGWNNAGGLQVAGPGFLVVQAGGDIGPFLPAAHNLKSQASVQEGIASVGNASDAPVGGDIYVTGNGGSVGLYDAALYGPISNPRRNAALTAAAGTSRGADIIVMFGAKYGADYQAVIDRYINPANAATVSHNYLAELKAFLDRVGIATTDPQDAWNKFSNADKLPTPPVSKELQQVFVDQVFFAELKTVSESLKDNGAGQYQIGYQMINTLFPSSLGYTANALNGGLGTNGANQLVKTGDLNLLHGTIQSRLGGDISIFGPGGSILVGPLASEPNPNLKLPDLGILSLGGGAINTFTDANVLVNSSRVLTTQGGDILMWSSNGDLDAGRGSKTTLSQPALQVQFDANDYQTVDLAGFVSGAGIGTLQASKKAAKADVYLFAPRGKIDAGDAGIRITGKFIPGTPVLANASNIQVGGNTYIPVIASPPTAALAAGSNTAGAAAKSADAPTASGNRDRASVFLVEVVGYGGGDSVTPGAGPAPTPATDATAAPASGQTQGQNQGAGQPADSGRSSDDKSSRDDKAKRN